MMKRIVLSVLSLFPFVSMANTHDEPWLKCTQITDNAMRLACFDGVSNNKLNDMVTHEEHVSSESVKEDHSIVSYSAHADDYPPDATDEHSVQERQDVENQTLLSEAGVSDQVVEQYTPLSLLYDLDGNDERGVFSIRAHNSNYILPVWHNFKVNDEPGTPKFGRNSLYDGNVKKTEAKFQISFKTKMFEDIFGTRADIWFGYTQQSHWQVYNSEWSSPFRDTDYQPEIFITQPTNMNLPWGMKLRMVGAGAVHQSNGQSDPWSRSWNRVYGMAGFEWGKVTILPRVWWRIPEKSRKDDNPDITKYMGYGDLKLAYQYRDHLFSTTLQYNPKHGKGGARLEYAFPISGKLKGYIQYYDGYGENLLDYNFHHRSLGIGVMLLDWGGV
ncbi:phospholipase A [Neisseria sp. Ec49-e6-T10]|uniref:phospholipase A n=1 Tax=Neisseria sp. Ec49-e6-T10 TaxID=3140744 RepID=UPI003EB9569A